MYPPKSLVCTRCRPRVEKYLHFMHLRIPVCDTDVYDELIDVKGTLEREDT